MNRGIGLFIVSLLICVIGMPANAVQLTDRRFLISLTYEGFQELERESPELAYAYLNGMAEGIYASRVIEADLYTFCTPEPTTIDPELLQLMATNEVRLHGADTGEYYMHLVKQGLLRAFPRTPENCG